MIIIDSSRPIASLIGMLSGILIANIYFAYQDRKVIRNKNKIY